jgi:hypothetical protein
MQETITNYTKRTQNLALSTLRIWIIMDWDLMNTNLALVLNSSIIISFLLIFFAVIIIFPYLINREDKAKFMIDIICLNLISLDLNLYF